MMLSTRWTTLDPHPVQDAYKRSEKRFIITDAGRRSGKSEIAKRKLVKRAGRSKQRGARFLYSAPTHDQSKDIAWNDLKALTQGIRIDKSEGDRVIILPGGKEIHVAGMDVPERAEGSPLDGIVLDEFANMKEEVWGNHVRPALSTRGRLGWAIIPSVPEGRNHYFKLYEAARADIAERGDASEWGIFHWNSAEVIDPAEIEAARRDLDPLTFAQEYEGSFVNFTGLAYYRFSRSIHAIERLAYNPRRPLIFCFDFNRSPGVAVVCQIQDYHPLEPLHRPEVARRIYAAIGEVHIPQDSTTPAVCARLIHDWAEIHSGPVFIYGDASGGNQGSAKVHGSDWDLVRATLKSVPHWELHERIKNRNPEERPRVNAVNSALRSVNGLVSVLVDPVKCRRFIEDFECTTVLPGGSGELYKPKGKAWPYTHMTDGFGYFIDYEKPIHSERWVTHPLG